MLARILFNRILLAQHTTPNFNFTESDGKLKLNITVEIDPRSFVVVPDSDRTTDPVIRRTYRDATIGLDLINEVRTMEIQAVDVGDDTSIFTFSAVLDTKLPGTGGTPTRFKLHQESQSQPFEN